MQTKSVLQLVPCQQLWGWLKPLSGQVETYKDKVDKSDLSMIIFELSLSITLQQSFIESNTSISTNNKPFCISDNISSQNITWMIDNC